MRQRVVYFDLGRGHFGFRARGQKVDAGRLY